MRAIILLGLVLAGGAAMADEDPLEAGRLLFEANCVACHGEDATEGDGGDIRGVELGTVRRATHGIEAMPEFDFTEDELRALTAWLDSL